MEEWKRQKGGRKKWKRLWKDKWFLWIFLSHSVSGLATGLLCGCGIHWVEGTPPLVTAENENRCPSRLFTSLSQNGRQRELNVTQFTLSHTPYTGNERKKCGTITSSTQATRDERREKGRNRQQASTTEWLFVTTSQNNSNTIAIHTTSYIRVEQRITHHFYPPVRKIDQFSLRSDTKYVDTSLKTCIHPNSWYDQTNPLGFVSVTDKHWIFVSDFLPGRRFCRLCTGRWWWRLRWWW